jgi:hypothetical protein
MTLLQSWRENPIAVAGIPIRGSRRRSLAFWMLLLSVSLGSIIAGITFRFSYAASEPVYMFYAAAALIPPLSALCLHLFGYRHRAAAELEELILTRLDREEVVFGAVFWPVVIGAAVAAALAAGYVISAVGHDPIPAILLSLLLLLVLWLASVGAAVRAWILAFGSLLHLFLYTIAVAGAVFLLAELLGAMGWQVHGLVIAAIAAVYIVLHAGHFAGLRFFAPVDWEALCRAYWLTNELVAFFEFDERRPAMKQLRRRNTARPLAFFAGWAAGGLLLLLLGGFLQQAGPKDPSLPRSLVLLTRWLGNPVFAMFSGLVAAFVALAVRFRRQQKRFLVLAGSIHVTIAMHILPAVLPFAFLPGLAGVIGLSNSRLGISEVRFFTGSALTLFLAAGMTLWLFRRPGRKAWIWVGSILAALLLAFLAVRVTLADATRPVEFLFLRAPRLAGPDLPWEGQFLFLMTLPSLLLLAAWSRLCQGLHSASLSRVERHSIVEIPPQSAPRNPGESKS